MDQSTATTKGNAADEGSERSNASSESTSRGSQSLPGSENAQQQQQQQGESEEQKKQRAMFEEKTQAVDDLLKREMMQLSLQARNDIQEEIHGVKCLASNETPQLLEQSLSLLDAQLEMIARSSTSIPPNVSTRSLLLARNLGNESFANSPNFKLRFLRCELFHVRKAALRLCEYLYRIHSLFGDFCLRRELDLYKDFTKEELRYFRKGFFQFLPFRDRSGRRILIVFPHEDFDTMTQELKAKFIVYFSTAGTTDVETQRKGLVIVIWFNKTYKINNIQLPMNQSPLQNYGKWGCVRVSAMHVCTPDTPAFRFRRSIMALRFNQNQRSRLKIHVGESIELRYSLQGFGMPTEHIPLTWSGNIKTVYFKNWMKLRKAIDADMEAKRQYMRKLQNQAFSNPNDISRSYSSIMSGVVECPNSNDVAFRQGTSLAYHPGNARFRSLIESSVLRLRDALSGSGTAEGEPPSIQISSVVSEIFRTVIHQDNGRVLVWTSNHNGKKYGCWCIITNEDQIYSKIDYAVREHIRGVGTATQAVAVSRAEKQKANLQTSESSTSIFRQESPTQSCTEAASNLLCGTTETEEASSMPNKRAKLSASTTTTNDDANVSSSDEDSSCQLFCQR